VIAVRRPTKSPLGDAIRRVIDERDVWCAVQPSVDVRTQKIFAYEALARTKAPDFDGPLQLFAAPVARSRKRT
jgi:EAL domain-containing protein (putative c-di-GMP-specific phosphodiesterase class I)